RRCKGAVGVAPPERGGRRLAGGLAQEGGRLGPGPGGGPEPRGGRPYRSPGPLSRLRSAGRRDGAQCRRPPRPGAKAEGRVQHVRLTLAELTLVDAASAEAISARNVYPDVEVAPLLADAHAALAKARDALAAQARRAAVLQSLAGLGYEVGEGLATAWVDQG